MKKRLVALIVSIVMVMGSIGGAQVFAAETTAVDAAEIAQDEEIVEPEVLDENEDADIGFSTEDVSEEETEQAAEDESVQETEEEIVQEEGPAQEEEKIIDEDEAGAADEEANEQDDDASETTMTSETAADDEKEAEELPDAIDTSVETTEPENTVVIEEETIESDENEAVAAISGWRWPFESTSLSRNYAQHGYSGVDVSVGEWTTIYAPTDAVIKNVYRGCNHHSGLKTGVTCEQAGECSSGNYSRYSDTYGFCNNGFGNGVVIYSESENLTIQFAHMMKVADGLYAGMRVNRDTLLGYVGDTGNATGVHCHYAVSRGGNYWENFIDPMSISYSSNRQPYGYLDSCSGGIGVVYVGGWAVDPDASSSSINVHVYVGGPAGQGELHRIVANVYRSDVNTAYGITGNHGFDTSFTTNKTGTQSIYMYGIDTDGGDNPLLGSGTVTITANKQPQGTLLLCSGEVSSVTVSGYVYDPNDRSKDVTIQVYVGAPADQGGEKHVITTNGNVPLLGRSFKSTFETSKTGSQKIYLYAVDINDGSRVLLASPTVTITERVDLSKATVTLDKTEYTYNGKAVTPKVTVTYKNTVLTLDKEYTVTYSNNTGAGTGIVQINATSYSKGSVSTSFKINKGKQTATAQIADVKIVKGNSSQITLSSVKESAKATYASSDSLVATVSATGEVTAQTVGIATITVTAKETTNYKKKTIKLDVNVVPAASKKVTIYNVAQGLKVTWLKVDGATRYNVYRDNQLIKTTSGLEITDGDVKYRSGEKFTYKVVATAKDVGESTVARTGTYYRLMPVGIKSVTNPSAGKMTVTYDKSSGSSGYVVRYGLKSDMSDAKVLTVKGEDTTSRTFSNLTKGKKYYVQVRTYKIDNGIRYYSGYCTTKTVIIAK